MIKNIKKNNLCFMSDFSNVDIEPSVMDNPNSKETTIWFNGYYSYENIYKLMTQIDSVVQSGGYEKINLYYSSDGGEADSLFALSNYLNNINNIDISIRIVGMVASCGFYLLTLLDNPNISLEFTQSSSGLIHLGDILISARGLLSKESSRYCQEKFLQQGIDDLNKYLKEEILDNLELSDIDRDKLNQGNDVMLQSDELEKIIISFHEKRYYKSDSFIEDIISVKHDIEELQQAYKSLGDQYKYFTGCNVKDIFKNK